MTPISVRKKILFSAAVAAAFLALAECLARVVELIDPDDWGARVQVEKKRQGTYRIFFCGGSTTYGTPLVEFGFVSQLEFWLRETRPDAALEVHNCGELGASSGYVRRMVEKTVVHDPDLLVVLTGHNEFLDRSVEGAYHRTMPISALARIAARVRRKVQGSLRRGAAGDGLGAGLKPYDRGSRLFDREVRDYQGNIRRIAGISRRRGIPLILMTAASNLADWPPAHKTLARPAYAQRCEGWRAQIDGLLEREAIDDALTKLRELRRAHPDDPMLLFLHGRALARAGLHDRAKSLFVRAKDLDRWPCRALTVQNECVRQAASRDGCALVDAERALEKAAEHGLVGFQLMTDNCHPTLVGSAIIARELYRAMSQQGLFLAEGLEPPPVGRWLARFRPHLGGDDKCRELDVLYRLEAARICSTAPFRNFGASRMHVDEALGIAPSDWRVRVALGSLAFFEKRVDEGRRQLSAAARLRGEPVHADDCESGPRLRDALRSAGIADECFAGR